MKKQNDTSSKMSPSSEERAIRIKEVFEKHDVTTFWGAYSMLTEEAGCADLVSFEDCVIHFGCDNLFDNVSHIKVYVEEDSDCDDDYHVILKYKLNNIHPKLNKLVEFCKTKNIDWSDIDGASETVKFKFSHVIIVAFFKAEYKKAFKQELSPEDYDDCELRNEDEEELVDVGVEEDLDDEIEPAHWAARPHPPTPIPARADGLDNVTVEQLLEAYRHISRDGSEYDFSRIQKLF